MVFRNHVTLLSYGLLLTHGRQGQAQGKLLTELNLSCCSRGVGWVAGSKKGFLLIRVVDVVEGQLRRGWWVARGFNMVTGVL